MGSIYDEPYDPARDSFKPAVHEHKNPRFNVIQAESNKPEFVVIDGQRLPGGYAAPGAKTVTGPMSRDTAIVTADLLQTIADSGESVQGWIDSLGTNSAPPPAPLSISSKPATNEDRAGWARNALDGFAKETGMVSDVNCEDDQTILTDLLGDLMHLAHQEGMDWAAALAQAAEHFNFELENDE